MLRKKSDLIKQLTQYSKIPEKIVEMDPEILSVTYQTILESQCWRDKYGLMVNDSIIMASIHSLKIENLATSDSDFDHIPNLAVWKPGL
jgi:predicted nucleic acid-binding protein